MDLEIDTCNLTPQKQKVLNFQESPIPPKHIETERSQTENLFDFQGEESSFVTQIQDFIPHSQREIRPRRSEGQQTNDKFVTKKDFQKLKQEIQRLQYTMNNKFDEFIKSNEISNLKEQKNTEDLLNINQQMIKEIKVHQNFQPQQQEEEFQPQRQIKNFKRCFLSQQVSPRNFNQNSNNFQNSLHLKQNSVEKLEEYRKNQKQPKQFNFAVNIDQQERNSHLKSQLKIQPQNTQGFAQETLQEFCAQQEDFFAKPYDKKQKESYKQETNDQQQQQLGVKIHLQQLQEENLFINKKLQQTNLELQQKSDKIQVKSQEIRSLQEQLSEKQKIIADLIKQNQKLTNIQKNFVKSYEYELQQKENENFQLQSYLTQVQSQFAIQVKDLEAALNHSVQKNRKQKEEWIKIYQEQKRENEHLEERLKTKDNENQLLKKSLKQLQSLLNNF